VTKRSWMAAGLSGFAALFMAGSVLVSTAVADKDPAQDRQRNRPRTDVPPAWSEPVVMGVVNQVMWVESKTPGQQTAAMIVWSSDSDLNVTIYGDDPSVRQALIDGLACVGRYVVVGGDRLDESTMVGRSIEVPNLDMPCTATLQ
jgi:hypothetical protein